MVFPNGIDHNKKGQQSMQRSPTTGNESMHDSLRHSIHSSDGSLQLSDDEADNSAVATTRLNTWLNGGSNEAPLQLGTGTITATTPVNPFVASNDLPSPFSVRPPSSTHRYTAPPLEVPNISLEPRNTSTRSRLPPSPPKTLSATNHDFQNFLLAPPPDDIQTSFNSVFVESTTNVKKSDDNNGTRETIQGGESFRFSNINASNTDAATERITTDIPPKPHHQHHRSVSWGEKQETMIPPKAPKTSPKLSPVPSRHHRAPSEFSLFSVLTQTDSEASPNRINVDEILRMNPLETEAETLILKVIEAQENNTRQRANTGHSGILENVPDDAAHIFMPPIETLSSKSSATGTAKNERQGGNSSDPSTRPHSNTVEFVSTATNTINSNMASSPTLPAAPIQSNQRPPRPNLTRNATVEHKLANLTEALAGYHNKTVEGTYASNNALNQRTEIEEAHHADVSAGEKLAKNANLIYRGRQKTEGKKNEKMQEENVPEGDHIATTKPSHWTKIRTVTSVTQSKVNDANTNQTSAAIPSTSNHTIPMVPGSVEERKKMDGMSDDVEQAHHSGADMECGTAAGHNNDNQMKLNESTTSSSFGGGGNGKNGKNWKIFQKIPIINSRAARDFRSFAGQRRSDLYTYLRFMIVVVIPALTAAMILFHFAGNPNTGIVDFEQSGNGILFNRSGQAIDPTQASVSWWLIFICVRQTLTFSGAQLLQVIIIDFLCLSTRFSVNVLGSLITLFIVQSKGWPFIAFMWGILNFALLYGSSKFVNHWLFWQDFMGVFNEKNPSGDITADGTYMRILAITVCLGFIVALKRLWLGLFLGRKTYTNYAEDLTKLVDKIVILCEIAALSREIEDDLNGPASLRRSASVTQYGITKEEFVGILEESNNDDGSSMSRNTKGIDYQGGLIVDPTKSDLRRVRLDQSQRAKITELLGAWEEPDSEMSAEEDVSISGILQFRNSLSYLSNSYIFSIAWGETTTRDRTIIGSQEVFGKLMKRSTDENLLNFEVLATIAKQPDGTLSYDKLRRIIRILRPDRDGFLSLLEFVKSVDVIYKEAKLLRASVLNSEKIDRAFEKAFNVVFYILVLCVILGVVGLNPLRLIVSLTSVIVGFAFMVGSASSKMFEGWLFILVRRPYNIGDRIHISNIETDVDPNGSLGWIVKDLTLFHTTAVYGMTGERATMSNGSLASSRVINMARSPKANIYIYLKFSTDTPYERVQIFEKALREFIKSRPREWANFAGFRATKVWADLGYIEYAVVLIHREAWQSITSIVESKAEVSSFCLELSKKMGMRYRSPPLPVDLAFVQRNHISTTASTTNDSTMQPPAGGGIASTDTNSEIGAKIAAAMTSNPNYNSYEDVSAMHYKEVAAIFNKK